MDRLVIDFSDVFDNIFESILIKISSLLIFLSFKQLSDFFLSYLDFILNIWFCSVKFIDFLLWLLNCSIKMMFLFFKISFWFLKLLDDEEIFVFHIKKYFLNILKIFKIKIFIFTFIYDLNDFFWNINIWSKLLKSMFHNTFLDAFFKLSLFWSRRFSHIWTDIRLIVWRFVFIGFIISHIALAHHSCW